MAKRAVDVVLSALGLIVLAPLLLLIAVWIKADSPGPVFFRQTRVGRGCRTFEIHKFRTMKVQNSPGAPITVGADPRITRAGRFLRKYKLDELPQLIDVVAGNMSLVGPRPEVPGYVALYAPDVRDIVLSVRPGITDDASIEFRDESELLARSATPERTYVDEILPRKLELYVRYVRQRSFMGDIRIIGRTILALGRR